MNIVVARQPIFDKNLKVVAYELLYRSNFKINEYTGTDGDRSTASVIMGAFLNGGLERMTNNKRGFINFTDNLIKSDIIKMFHKKYLVIEILETVEATDDILTVCSELKKLGYTIALDDFVFNSPAKNFMQYAKIIKMDFLAANDFQLQSIVHNHKNKGIKFLAERIETKEDFIKAKTYGYHYFQGYYFCRPSIIENKVLLPMQINTLQVMGILQNDNCEISELAKIIGYDPGMSYKLLKIANSIIYGGKHKIKNIKVALARIGLRELKRWMLFLLAHGMHMEKPSELIKQSTIRAKVAEEICIRKKLGDDSSDFLLLGLFSLLDVIMDMHLDKILSTIDVSSNIKTALLNPGVDTYSTVIRLIKAYDEGEWDEAERAGSFIELSLEEYSNIYLEAIKWCDHMYERTLDVQTNAQRGTL